MNLEIHLRASTESTASKRADEAVTGAGLLPIPAEPSHLSELSRDIDRLIHGRPSIMVIDLILMLQNGLQTA